MKKIRTFSLFSGVGGFEIGFDDSFDVLGFSEIDPKAAAVLAYRYPGIKNYGDITQINIEDLPDFDFLVGGSPCQSFSIAGKRNGLSGKSGLIHHYLNILERKKPSYFIWENVKGTLSSTEGWDFACVQMEMVKLGYNIRWEVLDSKEFGVPQNRERIYIVGFLGGRERSELLYQRLGCSEYEKEESRTGFLF